MKGRPRQLQAAASTHNIALDGTGDAIASANLQSRIEELAASAGIAIGSTEGLAAESRSGYRRIGLHLAVSGEYDTLIKLLAAIEGRPLRSSSTICRLRGAITLQPIAPSANARLNTGFEVYGFRSHDMTVGVNQ